jgi:choline dehydrogenase-like flavoprotein
VSVNADQRDGYQGYNGRAFEGDRRSPGQGYGGDCGDNRSWDSEGKDNFDVCVIGAGAGGLQAAEYFSARNYKTLIISDGLSGYSGPSGTLGEAIGATAWTGTPIQDEQYTSPQLQLNLAGSVTQLLCKATGGCTRWYGTVNGVANDEFYDQWTANPKYNTAAMRQAFKNTEDHWCYNPALNVGPYAIPSDECLAKHGRGGPVTISPQAFPEMTNQSKALIAYAMSNSTLGYNADWSSGSGFGVSWEDNMRSLVNPTDISSLRKRVDAYTAFYNSSVQARSNLKLWTSTRALYTRDSDHDGDHDVVEYIVNGTIRGSVRCRQAIILAAGVTESPAILERGGIGDPAVLAAAGIPVKIANSGVGARLKAHKGFVTTYQLKKPCNKNYTVTAGNEWEWMIKTGKTPGLQVDGQVEGVMCSSIRSLETKTNGITDSGIMLDYLNGARQDYISAEAEYLYPQSEGSIHIRSASWLDKPVMDFGWNGSNLFTRDLDAMMEIYKQMTDLFTGNNTFAQEEVLGEIIPGEVYKNVLRRKGYSEGMLVPPFYWPFEKAAFYLFLSDSSMHHLYHMSSTIAQGYASDADTGEVNNTRIFVADMSGLFDLPGRNPTRTLWAKNAIQLPLIQAKIGLPTRRWY